MSSLLVEQDLVSSATFLILGFEWDKNRPHIKVLNNKGPQIKLGIQNNIFNKEHLPSSFVFYYLNKLLNKKKHQSNWRNA